MVLSLLLRVKERKMEHVKQRETKKTKTNYPMTDEVRHEIERRATKRREKEKQ